jgi:hypothetical protein
VGQDVSDTRLAEGSHAVMMIPIPRTGIYRGVQGVEKARGVAGIEDIIVTAKEGQAMVPLPEGASYLGFIFSRGETPERAVEALRQAHAFLQLEFAEMLTVVRG